MSDIKTVAIDRYNLITQAACAILILLAYVFSKSLMWVAGAISLVYILSNTKWEQKFAFFAFLLLFSPVFKLDSGQTSLFMFVRIAIIVCFAFKHNEKISFYFLTALIGFFTYCMIISEVLNTSYLVSLINICIWVLIGYVIFNTLTVEKTTPVIRSLSNAIIITGLIGLVIEKVPFLANEINILYSYAEDGAKILRYAGLFTDPNFFTVLLISSLWFIYYEFSFGKINITEFLTRTMLSSFLGLYTMSKSCIILLIIFWIYVLVSKNDIKTPSKVVLFFSIIIAAGFFIYKNPYWISDLLFRFTGETAELDINTVTTGRTDLWSTYIEQMLDNFSWFFGNGLNVEIIGKIASHNTVIQLFFNIGVVGLLLYIFLFVCIYKSVKKNGNKASLSVKMSFISLMISFMFLDGLFIEMVYYLLPLSFVYLTGVRDVNNIQQPLTDELI